MHNIERGDDEEKKGDGKTMRHVTNGAAATLSHTHFKTKTTDFKYNNLLHYVEQKQDTANRIK